MFPGASRSDLVIAIGAPVVGLLAMIAGLSTGDVTTTLFGSVAVFCGLMFAVPLARRGRQDPDDDEL